MELIEKRAFYDEKGLPTNVPPQFRKMGFFWYSANLLYYLFHSPNEGMLSIINKAKDEMEWTRMERPLLTMHVRHGDVCAKTEEERTHRRCEPL
jgi:hypothetical protein